MDAQIEHAQHWKTGARETQLPPEARQGHWQEQQRQQYLPSQVRPEQPSPGRSPTPSREEQPPQRRAATAHQEHPDPPLVEPDAEDFDSSPPPPSRPRPRATLRGELELELCFKLKASLSADLTCPDMDVSTLVALTVCPAMLGIQEAIRQSQAKNKREEHRARRCNLVVQCVKHSIRSKEVENRPIVLRDGKLYINTGTALSEQFDLDLAHPFTGYYLPYPDSSYEGLVTTICPDPPILNWVFVDAETHALRYGVRADADGGAAPGNITGPFDCTRGDRRLTLQGWEGFVAVEEVPGVWAMYFDKDDNGLRGRVPKGLRILEVEVQRRETKIPPPQEGGATTLDEKMAELKRQGQEGGDSGPADGGEGIERTEPTQAGTAAAYPGRAGLELRQDPDHLVSSAPSRAASVFAAAGTDAAVGSTPATSVRGGAIGQEGYEADVEPEKARYHVPSVEDAEAVV